MDSLWVCTLFLSKAWTCLVSESCLTCLQLPPVYSIYGPYSAYCTFHQNTKSPQSDTEQENLPQTDFVWGKNIRPPLLPAALGAAILAMQQSAQNEEQLSCSASHCSEFGSRRLGLSYLLQRVSYSLINRSVKCCWKKLYNEPYRLFEVSCPVTFDCSYLNTYDHLNIPWKLLN